MSVAPWDLGRLRQAYVKDDTSYGVPPSLAATNAMRVQSLVMHYDPQALVPSHERHSTPGQRALFRRRATASIDLQALLYPSGTLNTLPEANTVLKNAFGAAPSNITLAATVLTAASTPAEAAPSTTQFAITDFTGLVAKQTMVVVNLSTGANAGNYLVMVTAIAAAAGSTPKKLITVSPALPSAPILTDTVSGCVTYLPATAAAPTSMDFAYYPNSFTNREMPGWLADKLSFMFDSNAEPSMKASGPAARLVTSPQSQPGAFTTVGAENAIPSGLYGYFRYGGTAYEIEKLTVEIVNNYDVQNTAFGTSFANAALRKDKRTVMLTVDAKVSNDLTLWTPAITPGPTAPTENNVWLQCGLTAAQIWAVYFPRVLFLSAPDVPDGDGENNFQFKMQALETTGNDEMALGQG